MGKASLSEQPLVIKAAVFVTFFNSWVIFEEFVIDRVGLWRYMPFYRVAKFCVWDVLALAAIGLGLFFRPQRVSRPDEATSSPRCAVRWCPLC
jgi:hypothetical protein